MHFPPAIASCYRQTAWTSTIERWHLCSTVLSTARPTGKGRVSSRSASLSSRTARSLPSAIAPGSVLFRLPHMVDVEEHFGGLDGHRGEAGVARFGCAGQHSRVGLSWRSAPGDHVQASAVDVERTVQRRTEHQCDLFWWAGCYQRRDHDAPGSLARYALEVCERRYAASAAGATLSTCRRSEVFAVPLRRVAASARHVPHADGNGPPR